MFSKTCAQLFWDITEPFQQIKLFICDLFLKISLCVCVPYQEASANLSTIVDSYPHL